MLVSQVVGSLRWAATMRFDVHVADDTHQCAVCGAIIDIPDGAMPQVEIRAATRIVRVLRIEGVEVHRCVVGV